MIIILNGLYNSGKSSTALELTELVPRSAFVDFDVLRHLLPGLPEDEFLNKTSLEVALAATRVFIARKMDVIFAWSITQAEYDLIVSLFNPLGVSIHAFTLDTHLEMLYSNRGDREPSDKDRKMIQKQYEEGRSKPAFGTIINNTYWTAEQTARHILSLINLGQG